MVNATLEGWYEDPAGRFDGRFFDGDAWTARVSNAGSLHLDVEWLIAEQNQVPVVGAHDVEVPVAEVPVAEVPVADIPVVEALDVEVPGAEIPVAEAEVAEVPIPEDPEVGLQVAESVFVRTEPVIVEAVVHEQAVDPEVGRQVAESVFVRTAPVIVKAEVHEAGVPLDEDPEVGLQVAESVFVQTEPAIPVIPSEAVIAGQERRTPPDRRQVDIRVGHDRRRSNRRLPEIVIPSIDSKPVDREGGR